MSRTIRAHFDGKVFVPDEPVDLPTGQSVDISLGEESQIPTSKHSTPGPLAAIAAWSRTLPLDPTSPGDRAAQHDHYLYGTPKRENP